MGDLLYTSAAFLAVACIAAVAGCVVDAVTKAVGL